MKHYPTNNMVRKKSNPDICHVMQVRESKNSPYGSQLDF